MKREETRPPVGLLILYRILIAVVLVLVLILAAGTVYALLRPRQAPRNETTAAAVSGEEAVFSALGTQRVSTAGENPETVIVTIAFPYDRSDGPFSEELVSRIPDFKAQTGEYFGSFTAESLRLTDITVINRELLTRYNALLHLGQIKELYFLEYIWL
jgi:flagellar basal body-associated protein FliL